MLKEERRSRRIAGRLALLLLAGLAAGGAAFAQSATEELLRLKGRQSAASQADAQEPPLTATEQLLKLKAEREGRVWRRPGSPPPADEVSEHTVVEARGLAPWYKDDPARAREEALEAAFRDAVQQVSGVALTSETETQNFSLVRDEVITRSQGFIKRYEVISEKQVAGEAYEVSIRAETSPKAFIDQVNASLGTLYEQVGRPRMLVAIQSQEESAQTFRIVERLLRKQLIKQGFILVDPSQPTAHTRGALLAQAREQGVELLFLGESRFGEQQREGQAYVYEGIVGADVLRVDNGQVMASEVALGRAKHQQRNEAALASLTQAADTLLDSVAGQVTYTWISEKQGGTRVEVQIENISLAQVSAVRRMLANQVRGVKRVSQRSFAGSKALLEAFSTSPAEKLAESINGLAVPGGTLVIKGLSANRILARLQASTQ